MGIDGAYDDGTSQGFTNTWIRPSYQPKIFPNTWQMAAGTLRALQGLEAKRVYVDEYTATFGTKLKPRQQHREERQKAAFAKAKNPMVRTNKKLQRGF